MHMHMCVIYRYLIKLSLSEGVRKAFRDCAISYLKQIVLIWISQAGLAVLKVYVQHPAASTLSTCDKGSAITAPHSFWENHAAHPNRVLVLDRPLWSRWSSPSRSPLKISEADIPAGRNNNLFRKSPASGLADYAKSL